MGANAALVRGVAVPADPIAGVWGVAEVPGDSIMDFGVPDGEACGIRGVGAFEMSGEGRKVSRGAV